MKRVLFFGTFDPIHVGHKRAFRNARTFGDFLIVVVARDSTISKQKKRASHIDENKRLAIVAADISVDEAILGDENVSSYNLLTKIPFDILALGYDQKPSDDEVALLLQEYQLTHVGVVRLQSFLPKIYKSSLLRPS